MQSNHYHQKQNHWPRKSAGSLMTDKIPVVPKTFTIGETHSYLTRHINNFDTLNYIYVIRDSGELTGAFSIRELFHLPRETNVGEISRGLKMITLLPDAHREEAVYLCTKHNIKAIPIVDEKNVLLGVVPSDSILTILNKELREDIMRLAGIHHSHVEYDNIMEISLFQAIKHRIPWLFVGLIGGFLAAKIVRGFEHTLESNLILAAFIPLVVYISDAIGTQLEAFTIRDLAVFRKLDVKGYFMKQLSIVSVMALFLGSAALAILYALRHDFMVAIVLGAAVVGASLSSLLTGVVVPIIFRKFKLDPANASGPIGTILQDISSVLIYFTIASLIL